MQAVLPMRASIPDVSSAYQGSVSMTCRMLPFPVSCRLFLIFSMDVLHFQSRRAVRALTKRGTSMCEIWHGVLLP